MIVKKATLKKIKELNEAIGKMQTRKIGTNTPSSSSTSVSGRRSWNTISVNLQKYNIFPQPTLLRVVNWQTNSIEKEKVITLNNKPFRFLNVQEGGRLIVDENKNIFFVGRNVHEDPKTNTTPYARHAVMITENFSTGFHFEFPKGTGLKLVKYGNTAFIALRKNSDIMVLDKSLRNKSLAEAPKQKGFLLNDDFFNSRLRAIRVDQKFQIDTKNMISFRKEEEQ